MPPAHFIDSSAEDSVEPTTSDHPATHRHCLSNPASATQP